MKQIFPQWAAATTFVLLSCMSQGTEAKKTVQPADPKPGVEQARLVKSAGRLPVDFIENRGQVASRYRFHVKGKDTSLYFGAKGMTYVLTKANGHHERPANAKPPLTGKAVKRSTGPSLRWTVHVDFVGANPKSQLVAEEKTDAVISYFKGAPSQWNAGLPTYRRLVYRNLWPGIDLVYRGRVDQLKYEFIVRPGADPAQIKLAYRGASSVAIGPDGNLRVETELGAFADQAPVSFQAINGKQHPVGSAFRLETIANYAGRKKTPVLRFELGAYDQSKTLIIDPLTLVYAGYIGGNIADVGYSIAVDASGNVYVAGYTVSSEATFPDTGGPDLTLNGGDDAFICKVNAAGTALSYCGFIGGSGADRAFGVAVDATGHAYVAGYTSSSAASFPVGTGPDLTQNGGDDAFICKVNPAGTALDYCGYIGGSSTDRANAVAVDASGNAYVAGTTQSSQATFPVGTGPTLVHSGSDDGFICKVNAAGTALSYCGYLGAPSNDRANGVAVDAAGSAYVVGESFSPGGSFPTTVGPDLTHNSGWDAFVCKVNPGGTAFNYCGFVGGSDGDYGKAIAVDASGNAYIAGYTVSSPATFPVTVGPSLVLSGGWDDAFVCKVNATGTALTYCGYIGGTQQDIANGVAVDAAGNAYVVGDTASTEGQGFPVTVGPDLTHNGGREGFLCKVNPGGTALTDCGYIGGAGNDYAHGVAVSSTTSVHVVGSASASISTSVGPDLTHNGDNDAWVVAYNQAVCGNGVVEGAEQCDPGANVAGDCCTAGCAYESGGTSCRAAAGECDTAETCSGSSASCPADDFVTAGTGCTDSNTADCNDAQCDGSGACDQTHAYETSSYTCRVSAGPCDPLENCTGSSGGCPGNIFSTAGTVCRATAGPCDVAETCSGSTAPCPGDAFVSSGTLCRAATGECDTLENCTGSAAACPADSYVTATTTCTDSNTNDCFDAQCDGSGSCDQSYAFESGGYICRSSAGDCDSAEQCSGGSGTCPADAKFNASTVCRPANGSCDIAEFCTGTSNTCPTADSKIADGAPCNNDSLVCNGTNQCKAGGCYPSPALSCDDGNICTDDDCLEPGGCDHTPVAGCCNEPADCDDSDSCTEDVCNANVCENNAIADCCLNDADCDDGKLCTADSCSGPGGSCAHAKIFDCCEFDADCDDSLGCTIDSCQVADALCLHEQQAGACCTSNSQCADSNPCTIDSCNLSTGACSNSLMPNCCVGDGDCQKPDPCSSVQCDNGSCSNSSIADCCIEDGDCADDDPCTANSCQLSSNTCSSAAIDGCCKTDTDCTPSTACDIASCDVQSNSCVETTKAGCCQSNGDCDDGDGCTKDVCLLPQGICEHQPLCVDGGPDDGGPDDANTDAAEPQQDDLSANEAGKQDGRSEDDAEAAGDGTGDTSPVGLEPPPETEPTGFCQIAGHRPSSQESPAHPLLAVLGAFVVLLRQRRRRLR